MRNLRRSNREEEEEESVFVPMTDMTVSFLFILMILLAFFAVRFSDKDTVPRSVHEELRNEFNQVSRERDNLIIERDKLVGEIASLKREIEPLRARIKDLEDENAQLRMQIRERDERIKELLAEIERLKREIEPLRARIKDLEAENAKLRDQIVAQDDRIKELQAQIDELQRKLNEQSPLEAYIAMAQVQRLEILRRIESALKIEFKDQILVEISTENDALRFKGEGLFASGARTLLPNKKKIIERLAQLVTEAISCYTVGNRVVNYSKCNPYGIVIEAVQIEGHTDDVGADTFNIELSTARANDAFFTMLQSQVDLLSYRNIRGQPVISVAGYGKMRPVAQNDTPAGKAENRRIDLRLIMYTPRDRQQVERIQQQIRDGLRLTVEEATSSGH
jgi:chemotaxis protein MotB